MRRIPVLFVCALATLVLGGCGLGGPTRDDAPSPAASSSASPSTSASASASASASSAPASSAPTPSASATTSAPAAAPAPATTRIEKLWVDDSWHIEDGQPGYDYCESGAYQSPYSRQTDMFICGSNAAGFEACSFTKKLSDEVLCITDATTKQATRFHSPNAAELGITFDPEAQNPIPLYVKLVGGATCAPISHDHDRHWHDEFSWYRCDDGSELLTDEKIEDTFHKQGDSWTVQRSVDMGTPEEVGVESATFAGR